VKNQDFYSRLDNNSQKFYPPKFRVYGRVILLLTKLCQQAYVYITSKDTGAIFKIG